jgi:hypothetical protein
VIGPLLRPDLPGQVRSGRPADCGVEIRLQTPVSVTKDASGVALGVVGNLADVNVHATASTRPWGGVVRRLVEWMGGNCWRRSAGDATGTGGSKIAAESGRLEGMRGGTTGVLNDAASA